MPKSQFSSAGLMWLAPLLVLGPALTCVAPKAMAALFIASAVFAVAADCLRRRALPEVDRVLATCLGVVVVYGAASRLWTINPEETLVKAGQLGLVFGLTTMLVPIVQRLESPEAERFGHLLSIGLGFGLAVYALEQILGFPLFNLANPPKARVKPVRTGKEIERSLKNKDLRDRCSETSHSQETRVSTT